MIRKLINYIGYILLQIQIQIKKKNFNLYLFNILFT